MAADYQADDARVAQQAITICGWADELLTLVRALPGASEPQSASDAPSVT